MCLLRSFQGQHGCKGGGCAFAQSNLTDLEKKRKEAASERAARNTKRAKLEVDVADLEEQIRKHEQTQVSAPTRK